MTQFYDMEDLEAFQGKYITKKIGKVEIETVFEIGKSYYDIIREMFTGRPHVFSKNRPGPAGQKREKKPHQITRLLRKSLKKEDYALVGELCKKFAGYNAGFITMSPADMRQAPDDNVQFPPEIMLCEPEKNVGLPIATIRMSRETKNLENNKKLQDIVKRFGSGTPFDYENIVSETNFALF